MIEVELTRAEWEEAARRGCQRQIDGLIRGRTSARDGAELQPTEGWGWNCNGASGEQVVAKWLGVPWDAAFGNLDAADVGGILEVRTVAGHHCTLQLSSSDRNDGCYVLVTGHGPIWRIQGYISGKRGKSQKWFHDRPGGKPNGRPAAYWVPQSELSRDLSLLKEKFLLRYHGGLQEQLPLSPTEKNQRRG